MDQPRQSSLGYSVKNIPIPSEESYMKTLIEKTTSFVRRLRWRAYHFLKGTSDEEGDSEANCKEHYGLKSRKSPPSVPELRAFEDDLADLVGSVTFRNTRDDFQRTLQQDITRIERSNSVFVAADKTTNLYEVGREQYSKLLQENVTRHYKIADENAYTNINSETRNIANKLERNLAERMDTMSKKQAYVTLKDHKDNFADRLPCRLINPAKPEMGKVSKQILDNVNAQLKKKLEITTWKNSAAVIDWFKAIDQKEKLRVRMLRHSRVLSLHLGRATHDGTIMGEKAHQHLGRGHRGHSPLPQVAAVQRKQNVGEARK